MLLGPSFHKGPHGCKFQENPTLKRQRSRGQKKTVHKRTGFGAEQEEEELEVVDNH